MVKYDELRAQIEIVINILEKDYQEIENCGVVSLIYKRYRNAYELLESNEVDINQLHILGGVRAYMDSYSDFNNPLLAEMSLAEHLLETSSKK